jgi:carbamoyl-phosphate synthase large subunit
MSIGRTFAESLQKAMRSMETGLTGLNEVEVGGDGDLDAVRAALAEPSPDRLLVIAQAFRAGLSIAEVHAVCHYDPWFLEQIQGVVEAESEVRATGLPDGLWGLLRLKKMGFSDTRLAELAGCDEAAVAARRREQGLHPVYKRVDTCAAEFESHTPYMYSAYEGDGTTPPECEARPSERAKVIILGGGPNRIGQGIEFDYCCVHAAYGLSEAGYETIMVNCNPETVSTDYDTSDRLYFEPLTVEDVLEIVRVERSRGELKGIIVQFGGQTPLKLAHGLATAGVPILGTSPDAIDLAEDRERFQRLLADLELRQPVNGIATSVEQAQAVAERIGYPVLVRPSYVLGGRAMEIVHEPRSLRRYMDAAVKVSGDSPVLIDSYLRDATEVDVDALADEDTVFVAGVMEHIEEAGIHSGDSACSLPPHSLREDTIAAIHQQTEALARGLGVVGLMNVQFAVQGDEIYVIEVNPRASRTVPFVAKAIGCPIAKIAARVMAGEPLSGFALEQRPLDHMAVKEAVFPFARFPGVDIILGPEMKSTGEVMGLDREFARAFAKSQLASGTVLPQEGCVFISVKDGDKTAFAPLAEQLGAMGFDILATAGTARYLSEHGIPVRVVNKVLEGRPHIVDAIKDGEVQLVFNTTEGAQAVADSYTLRRTALLDHIPYYTTVAGARAAVQAIATLRAGKLEVASLQSYSKVSFSRSS